MSKGTVVAIATHPRYNPVTVVTQATGALALEVMYEPEFNPLDFISPDVPEGYDTWWGYFSRENPEAFGLMDDIIEATREDVVRLLILCANQDVEPISVEASPYGKSRGQTQAYAYPIHILRSLLT